MTKILKPACLHDSSSSPASRVPLGQEICDLVVLSHLRWDFVFQRPQHLLSRFARKCRVFFVEEPIFGSERPSFEIKHRENGVQVMTPRLPEGLTELEIVEALRSLVDRMISDHKIHDFALWYYTPMALSFTRHLTPRAVAYDCMDELSLFQGAHPDLLSLELELFRRADLVFTGGQSLYEHKRSLHSNIHPFPSSIDRAHFAKARLSSVPQPVDQKGLPYPRIGFFGVIDERMNLDLLAGIARTRPEWQLVILGPVAKISPDVLPRLPNIHYLGIKPYAELPAYLAGWDAAMMPFALNDSTRFISPTKTPEFLAAGRPVVSTPIRDVVRPYGEEGLVRIAERVADFVSELEGAMEDRQDAEWLARVDAFLAEASWDETWSRMAEQLKQATSKSSQLAGDPASQLMAS